MPVKELPCVGSPTLAMVAYKPWLARGLPRSRVCTSGQLQVSIRRQFHVWRRSAETRTFFLKKSLFIEKTQYFRTLNFYPRAMARDFGLHCLPGRAGPAQCSAAALLDLAQSKAAARARPAWSWGRDDSNHHTGSRCQLL